MQFATAAPAERQSWEGTQVRPRLGIAAGEDFWAALRHRAAFGMWVLRGTRVGLRRSQSCPGAERRSLNSLTGLFNFGHLGAT